MSDKREGVSPVRVSRLKKRRRPREGVVPLPPPTTRQATVGTSPRGGEDQRRESVLAGTQEGDAALERRRATRRELGNDDRGEGAAADAAAPGACLAALRAVLGIDGAHRTGPSLDVDALAFPPCGPSSAPHLDAKQGATRTVPLSEYRFPVPKRGTGRGRNGRQPFRSTVEALSDNEKDKRKNNAPASRRKEKKRAAKQRKIINNGTNSSPAKNAPPAPLKYQGKVRIVSGKGATIREVFDIDESHHVIGKLSSGDERYFIEKKVLPPPPIALDASDDDASDAECVSVVRFKIALTPADFCSTDPETKRVSGEAVGWISDRGRLADDPYFIAKEV